MTLTRLLGVMLLLMDMEQEKPGIVEEAIGVAVDAIEQAHPQNDVLQEQCYTARKMLGLTPKITPETKAEQPPERSEPANE